MAACGRGGGQAGGELVAHDAARSGRRRPSRPGSPAPASSRTRNSASRSPRGRRPWPGAGACRRNRARRRRRLDQRHAVARQQLDQRFLWRRASGCPAGSGRWSSASRRAALAHDGWPARPGRCPRADGWPPRWRAAGCVPAIAAPRRRSAIPRSPRRPRRVTALRQVERVQRAVGDDDVVHRHRQAVGQVAQRDGAAARRRRG